MGLASSVLTGFAGQTVGGQIAKQLGRVTTTGLIGGAVVGAASYVGANYMNDYSAASANHTNEYERNRLIEDTMDYSGTTTGTRGLLVGVVAGGAIGRLGGVIGAGIGAVVGGAIGYSAGAFREDRIRSALTNDYMTNEDSSDVQGARNPYRSPNYIPAAVTGAVVFAGMTALGGMARIAPGTGMLLGAARMATSVPVSAGVGLGIGLKMSMATGGTSPDRNRIRGLGY